MKRKPADKQSELICHHAKQVGGVVIANAVQAKLADGSVIEIMACRNGLLVKTTRHRLVIHASACNSILVQAVKFERRTPCR